MAEDEETATARYIASNVHWLGWFLRAKRLSQPPSGGPVRGTDQLEAINIAELVGWQVSI